MKRVFLLLLACCLLTAPAAAAGGSGTAADPYIIQTAAELQSMQNNLAAHYKIVNDIDLSSVSWVQIGTSSTPFTGSIDGNNHIISNLVLTPREGNAGLFGHIGGEATIKNIILKNCKHTSEMTNVALLVANVYSPTASVIISNCHIYSSILISDHGYTGLLLGGAGGGPSVSISDCGIYDSIIIGEGDYVGLLQGAVASGTQETVSNIIIKNCIAYGSTVGGCFAGVYAYNAAPISSLSASNILIENCLIRATKKVGGIIGYHDPQYSEFALTDSTVKDTSILGATAGGLAT